MESKGNFLNPLFCAFSILIGIGQVEAQGVLKVPQQYANISKAVAAALDGDTILIAQGTYLGTGFRLIEIDKSLTIAGEYLYSRNLPDVTRTIIDCGGTNKEAFTLTGGSEVCVKFIGLTVTGFYEEEFDYSAIYIRGASAIFQACIFTGNESASFPAWGYRGTAISIEDSSDVKIYNCLFANNVGPAIGMTHNNYHQSPLYSPRPKVFITGCTFADNTDSGIKVNEGSGYTTPQMLITNCIFSHNGQYGILNGYPASRSVQQNSISNCLFFGNDKGKVSRPDNDLFLNVDTNALGYKIDSFGNFTAEPIFKPDSLADYPYQYLYNSPNVNTGSTDTFDIDNSITDIGFGNIKKFFDLECDYESLIASVEYVHSEKSHSMRLYPNPTSERVFIDGVSEGQNPSLIRVHTVSGQLVIEGHYSPKGIDVHGLKPGIFFITVTSNDRTYSQRLIVK